MGYKVLVFSQGTENAGRLSVYPVRTTEDSSPAPTGFTYVDLVEGTPAHDILTSVEGSTHPRINIYRSKYNFDHETWEYDESSCGATWNDIITRRNSLLWESDNKYAAAIHHDVGYAKSMWRDYRAHLRQIFDDVDFETEDPCEWEWCEGPFEIEAMSEFIQAGDSAMKVVADSKVRRGDKWYCEMYNRLGISTIGV